MKPVKKIALLLGILFYPLILLSQDIQISHPSGRYASAFYLKLSSPYDLRYTLDGSSPRVDGAVFTDSVAIGQVAVHNKYCLIPTNLIEYHQHNWRNREFGWRPPQEEVDKLQFIKVAGFQAGRRVTDELTLVYLIAEQPRDLPLVSLVTDSLNLFDEEIGIMVPGYYYDPENPYWSGNYYMRGSIWERKANLHYFLPDGSVPVSQDVGIRIHGGASRVAPQKSLRIYARDDYGASWLNFSFFPDLPSPHYKRLILRSGMTFWYERNTLFQDEYLQTLIHSAYPDIDVQAAAPAELFINGEHWGLVSLRERQDEYYVSAHYAIPIQEVMVIEPTVDRVAEFDRILDVCRHEDMSYDPNYQQIMQWLDVQNFARYMLLEMYLANEDWPQNNSKAWKRKGDQGKWKWLLYDLDACLAKPEVESVQRILESDAPLAIIFKSLIHHPDFMTLLRDEWIRMRDELFVPARMGPLLAEFIDAYEPGVDAHIKRWGNPSSHTEWQHHVNSMFAILLQRRDIFDQQLKQAFQWSYDSVDSVQLKNNWLVYPNPVQDVLQVSSKDGIQYAWRASLWSTDGRLLLDQPISKQNFQLDLTNYPSGLYLLNIQSTVHQISYRILKN